MLLRRYREQSEPKKQEATTKAPEKQEKPEEKPKAKTTRKK